MPGLWLPAGSTQTFPACGVHYGIKAAIHADVTAIKCSHCSPAGVSLEECNRSDGQLYSRHLLDFQPFLT